jgi:uncharacterized membrane protein
MVKILRGPFKVFEFKFVHILIVKAMKKDTLFHISVIVMLLFPFAYLAFVWAILPEQFVMNSNKPAHLVGKRQLLESVCFLTILNIIIFLITQFIDNQNRSVSMSLTNKFGLTFVAFGSSMSIYTVYGIIHPETGNFLFILTGLVCAFLGNLMHSLRPNHPMGFQLPWLLNNQDIWRKTHQFGGKIWFSGGLFMVLAAFVFPENWLIETLGISMMAMSLMTLIYSYRLYKKHS